jgi:hypothetical protein
MKEDKFISLDDWILVCNYFNIPFYIDI